ncbi:Hypothetical protein, putative [Bodo saltans]|uniref:Uncharacterized protein n=1 Tax=Bodo saltans TaxID=75058 RepID=A0A0S4J8U9_BODSA|nr:Hypothetical protein, putative [Bodo saltans]|eukprot:CUG87821.1 Hypothetical protein, putative [Bodo saltans]
MNTDVSKLRAACEALHLLQVKLQQAEKSLVSEVELQERGREALNELTRSVHHFSDHRKETSMLKRVLEEEASALAVLEKSLAAQIRFGESNVIALHGVHQRIAEELSSRAKIAADIRRLEGLSSRANKELREMKARAADQASHERAALEHLVSRESALQRVREEIQFCQRARACEVDNFNRMKGWAAKSHSEELRLFAIVQTRHRSTILDGTEDIVMQPPLLEPSLTTLKKESASLLEEVVVSARLLEDKYHVR